MMMHHLGSKVAMHVLKNRDLPFTKPEFPLLSTNCLRVIADNFESFPSLKGIKQEDKIWVYENIDINLYETVPEDSDSKKMKYSIAMLTEYIDHEPFWKNICEKHYKILLLDEYSPNYKSCYLSRYFQKYLQELSEYDDNEEEYFETLKAMRDYVHKLVVFEFRKEVDLMNLLQNLPNLRFLHLTMGRKKAGMDFEHRFVGMKISDVDIIAHSLVNLQQLTHLNLSGNQLDDRHLVDLTEKLEEHQTIKCLNLSHNKISNEGIRRISRLILKSNSLQNIDLTNNQIGYEGIRYISITLSENKVLKHLSLKLNYVSDQSTIKMFEDLQNNSTLEYLDLSANLLTDQCVSQIMSTVNNGKTRIKYLLLVSNKFTDESFDLLKSELARNRTLDQFDIGSSEMTRSNEVILNEIIIKKNLERKGITFISKKQLNQYENQEKNISEAPDQKITHSPSREKKDGSIQGKSNESQHD